MSDKQVSTENNKDGETKQQTSFKIVFVTAAGISGLVSAGLTAATNYFSQENLAKSQVEAALAGGEATKGAAQITADAMRFGSVGSCLDLQMIAAPASMQEKVPNPDFDPEASVEHAYRVLGPKHAEKTIIKVLSPDPHKIEKIKKEVSAETFQMLSNLGTLPGDRKEDVTIPAVRYSVDDIEKFSLEHKYYAAGSTLSIHQPWTFTDPTKELNAQRMAFCELALKQAKKYLNDQEAVTDQ